MVTTEKGAVQFGYLVAVAFTINYIVGTGFLTIPWAFAQAGCFLSVLVLSCIVYFSIAASLFILEGMARAETIHKSKQDDESAGLQADRYPHPSFGHLNRVGTEKYEVTELCLMFLGTTGRQIYTASLSLYMFCTLLAYSTVFSNALASHFDIGPASYHIYLTLYAIVVIPLSCFELEEQVTLQVTLALGRGLMFITMVATILHATLAHNNPFQDYQQLEHGQFQDVHSNRIHVMLPILVYANIFHHSIPALSQPVADKHQLGSIYTTTILSCYVAYLVLGVLVSLYFGKDTPASANLIWTGYTGLSAPAESSLFGRLVSGFVVIFPALDVLSCFPLCALTMGNNMMSNFLGDSVHEAEHNRVRRVVFRLLAAIPPVVVAYFVSDLGLITRVSGVCGFAVGFLFPSLLAYYSAKRMKQLDIPVETPYSCIFTTQASIVITLAVSAFSLVFFTVEALL